MNDFYKRMSKTILQIRLGMDEKTSQKDVADQAGISVKYYNDIENGRKHPTIGIVYSIASAFGMSLSELCDKIENQTKNI